MPAFLLIRWLSTSDQARKTRARRWTIAWDGDLVELNNPLPRWWLNMFYITLYFGIGYLALYPGLGTFKGLLELDLDRTVSSSEMDRADAKVRAAVREVPADAHRRRRGLTRRPAAWASACS